MFEIIFVVELMICFVVFFGIFVVMVLWEVVVFCCRCEILCVICWINNFVLVVVDIVIFWLLFLILVVGLVVMVEDYGWGLFNNIDVFFWFVIVVFMLVLDLVIYF